MRAIPNVVWGVVLGIVGVTTTGCAGGVDRDGATTFARPGGDDGDGLEDGDTGNDGTEDDGEAKAGGVSDSSDPSMDTGEPPDEPGAAEDDGGDAPPPSSEPPPQPPAPPQPGQVAPCEGMCSAYDACGIEPFANCAAIECVSEDGGGPCDQALAQLAICVASLPDCGAVGAYVNGFEGVYPCMDHDANVEFACGF